MSTATIPLLTVENYKILPETGPRYQLIEGDLYMAPAPNRYHQDISRNLEYILLDYLEENPIGKLYDAPFDVYLDQYNVFQPDILVVLNDRLSILTDAGAEGAPDFVVEILSPKTARLDKDNKRRVYATSGRNRKGVKAYYRCAREAGVNAGESPVGAIRRFSTADRANCVAVRRGGEQAWSRTGRSQFI